MKSQTTNVKVVAGVLLAVLVGACYWFLIKPGMSIPANLSVEQADIESQLSTVRQQVDSLQASQDNAAQLQADILASERRFPSQASESDVVDSATKLGQRTGVNVVNVTVGELAPYADPVAAAAPGATAAPTAPAATAVAEVYELPTTIVVRGRLGNIGRYADGLRTDSRAFTVTKVTTTSLPGGLYEGTITANAFVLPKIPTK